MLEAVAALDLPDGWIGAGAVRNRVWDALHRRDGPLPDADVDVVYFDPNVLLPDQDRHHEAALAGLLPGHDWQVRNQARMHAENGDEPYRDTADAMCHWPETATAIGARLSGVHIELLAPFGLSDLLGLIIRPTPAFRAKPEIFRARQAAKNWRERWPKLEAAA
ncbi:MAG: nucleotidyltransferase family protein [Minwuia sp.]|uniref:nucleotidyltransferase family protein n=1 Tax=Minwuia sp. TaxID=2493630 RepID=UPI003A891C6D